MRWILLAVLATASCAESCRQECVRHCTNSLDEAEALRACYEACKTIDGEEN